MKKSIIVVLIFYAILASLTIIFFNGTGGAGDSVYHYLFARYAPVHPALFFDHWAKPVFVLLACPFAQNGFIGIKIFNAIATGATLYLTYKTAVELNLKNAVLTTLFLLFAPLYYILTFSGLTEPLFALFLISGVYLCVKSKYYTAAVIISFLPFVRSEGLIVLGVFAFYLIAKKRWKPIPFLLLGTLVYSIAGYFVYHDILWTFSKIPYTHLNSVYGSGNLSHFAVQLLYVVGIPIYLLFWIGIVVMIVKTAGRKIKVEELILIAGAFLAYFVAHSLFWYLGIFNSMGLKRVLIGVIPLISLISLEGFNFLTEDLVGKNRIFKRILFTVLIAYILIFPFTSNPAALHMNKNLTLSKDQQAAIAAAKFIPNRAGDNYRIICSHPYLSLALHLDPFDSGKRIDLNERNLQDIKENDFIVWENWFALVESGISLEELDSNPNLENIYKSNSEGNNREIQYRIYKLKEKADIAK